MVLLKLPADGPGCHMTHLMTQCGAQAGLGVKHLLGHSATRGRCFGRVALSKPAWRQVESGCRTHGAPYGTGEDWALAPKHTCMLVPLLQAGAV